MSRWAIGIDLGGTAIKAALIKETEGIVHDRRIATDTASGASSVVAQLASLIVDFYNEALAAHFLPDAFAGVGLGAPSAVDAENGILLYPPNLPGWGRFPLRDELQHYLQNHHGLTLSVVLDNDANVAAFGEARYGAGRGFKDFLMVTLGTGVGGGIVLNRQIYRGANGTAGEVGFMIIGMDSDNIHAGIRGTVEGMLGKKAIVDIARRFLSESPKASTLGNYCNNDYSRLSPRHIEYAAHAGDTVAQAVWQRAGSLLGTALASVTALMDIRKFVIGGGISGAGELILAPARKQLHASTHPSMHDGLEVVPAFLGNKAGMHGAAALCF